MQLASTRFMAAMFTRRSNSTANATMLINKSMTTAAAVTPGSNSYAQIPATSGASTLKKGARSQNHVLCNGQLMVMQ